MNEPGAGGGGEGSRPTVTPVLVAQLLAVAVGVALDVMTDPGD